MLTERNIDWYGRPGYDNNVLRFLCGSAKVTGGPPGLQIRCGALKPSQVGSIPMHFRHFLPLCNIQLIFTFCNDRLHVIDLKLDFFR